ncbi:MAG: phosphate ABC transporter permease PstA [candidate division KSB1 bacterium]|nr:phosphate ABC transporter permease PstA [candidate division KSB1 bacterium]
MKRASLNRRRLVDQVVRLLSLVAAFLALGALGWILFEVFRRGGAALSFRLLTAAPTPPGVPGGGLGNAILGSLMMTVLAASIGVPLGILAGIFLAEYGTGSRLAEAVRFAANVLMGVPSILVGVFVYTVLVLPAGHFSGYAGAAALLVIMLPVMARTSEDMLRLVPASLREAGLALGVPRWRVTLGVVFRAAKVGLTTAGLLAVARISGETAPLLFTALNSPYWPTSLNEPTANLTVTIFNYAMSPYADWKEQAWAASLLITAGVLVLSIGSRTLLQRRRD